MSATTRHTIRCPACGGSFSVELWDAVNRRDRPDARDLLMANRLNTAACPDCGSSFRVDKPLIYADPDRRILIVWAPQSAAGPQGGMEPFEELIRRTSALFPANVQPPTVQLVFTRAELVERIFLLEAGLDQRLIEYIKYTMYARNAAKLPPSQKILLFNAQDSTEENLCFVVQDEATRRFEAVLYYRRDAYEALRETFSGSDKAPDLERLFPGPHVSARRLLLAEPTGEDETEPKG